MSIIYTANTPLHLVTASKYLGQKEVKATPNDSSWIAAMLAKLHVSWLRGQPWCGIFMARVMSESGLPYPKAYYRALDWVTWGDPCAAPHFGCIVVLKRAGGGHVALCAGVDEHGRLVLLGGNQGDAVSLITINPSDVYAYRAVPDGNPKMALIRYSKEYLAAVAGKSGVYG